MWLKTNSLLLALLVCGACSSKINIWDENEEPTEYGKTEKPVTTGTACLVKGVAGTCVENYLYCKTPHTGTDEVTWRSAVASCPDEGVCCKNEDVITPTTPNPTDKVTPTGCGIRNSGGVYPKAAGDVQQARFGEFPWTVAIYEVDKTGKEKYACVGSLIHPQVVLTVANRFDRGGTFTVRAGDWYLPSDEEIEARVDRRVKSITVHNEYSSGFGTNDIALLFLDGEIKQAAHINYACLPSANQATAAGTNCLVSGWGKASEDGSLQETQKMVTLQVLDHATCQTKLRVRNKRYVLRPSMMCAVGDGQDTCRGDGGAPLVCPYPGQEDRYYEAGITSWGYKCQSKELPGVYTNVANLRSWVDEKMKEKNLSTDTYTHV